MPCSWHSDDALRVASNPDLLRLAARHGDEAGAALVRHPGVAEDMIGLHGRQGALPLTRLDTRNARRLAMLSDDGSLVRHGTADELLEVVIRRSDAAMDFIWRHKGVLAGAAVLAAFLADPDPYIDGLKARAGTAADPVTEPAAALATEGGKRLNWTLLMLGVFTFGLGLLVLRRRRGLETSVREHEPGRSKAGRAEHGGAEDRSEAA